MQTRTLGATRLQVSPLGLGLAALGRPGYINLGHAEDLAGQIEVRAMEARAHAVLDLAWQTGIRYFDAARSYGLAENFLASWLQAKRITPSEVTIGSKWGYIYTAEWRPRAKVHEVKEHSVALLQRQWAESRTNLGDYLHLYQIHSATLESGVLNDPAILTELARLKDTGVIMGLSVSGPKQKTVIQQAAEVEIDGRRLFEAVQVTWNLLEPSTAPILQQVRAAGMGVIVKEALANGRLTQRNHDPAFVPKRDLLESQARRLHTTIDALALAAVVAQPWADVVLSGAVNQEQLFSNIRALEVAWDEEVSTNLARLAESPDTYWETRKRLPWT